MRAVQLVLEWARWRTQLASSTPRTDEPAINAVDIGISVQARFTVKVKQGKAGLNASFGFGDLAATIASQDTSVSVDIIDAGLKQSILPHNGMQNVSSVEQYIQSLNSFYAAVREVALAYEKLATTIPPAPVPPAPFPPADPHAPAIGEAKLLIGVKSLAAEANPFAEPLPVIAYYVANLPEFAQDDHRFFAGYVRGVAQVAQGTSCADHYRASALAESDAAFLNGILLAYRDFVGTRTCNDARIPLASQQNAKRYEMLFEVAE